VCPTIKVFVLKLFLQILYHFISEAVNYHLIPFYTRTYRMKINVFYRFNFPIHLMRKTTILEPIECNNDTLKINAE